MLRWLVNRQSRRASQKKLTMLRTNLLKIVLPILDTIFAAANFLQGISSWIAKIGCTGNENCNSTLRLAQSVFHRVFHRFFHTFFHIFFTDFSQIFSQIFSELEFTSGSNQIPEIGVTSSSAT